MIQITRSAMRYSCFVAMFVVSACSSSVPSHVTVSPEVLSAFGKGARSTPARNAGDLLYLSDAVSNIYIYSYPQAQLLGKIGGLNGPAGECVDGTGDVWVVIQGSNEILEYAHGGTEPIASLSDPGEPYGCAVDPITGNLAVTNYYPSTIEVYQHAEGSPTAYSSPYFEGYYYCTYDGSGDLFADARDDFGVIAELPYGGNALHTITLTQNLVPLSMQWDGSYLAIVGSLFGHLGKNGRGGDLGPVQIHRVSVSGSVGTVISEKLLKSPDGRHEPGPVQYWIAGKRIIGPSRYHQGRGALLTWRYPGAGMSIRGFRTSQTWGTALSSPASSEMLQRQ